MNNQAFKAKVAELKQRWLELDPFKRKIIMLIGMLSFFVLVASYLDKQNQQKLEPKRQENINKQVTRNNLVAPKVGEVGVAELKGLTQSELERQRQQQAALIQNQAEMSNDFKKGNQVVAQQLTDLSKHVASINDELNALKLDRESSNVGGVTLPPLQGIDSTLSNNQQSEIQNQEQSFPMENQQPIPTSIPEEVVAPRQAEQDPFRIIRSGKDASQFQSSGYQQGNTPEKQQSVQAQLLIQRGLTTGSILSGVLINGVDASSGRGRSNPVPALIRVKANAILPNRYTQAVKECFVLVSGVANMANERVEMRGEKIACIFKDGKVIDGPLSAFVVGEDGRTGVKGRKVSKNGGALARVIIAGTLSGLGKQLAPSQVPSINISGGSDVKYETPNLGEASKVAAATGAGNALDRLANYYMDIADERMDVLEVDAGRRITLILTNPLKGTK